MTSRLGWPAPLIIATVVLFACDPSASDHLYDDASRALAERLEAIPANRSLRDAVANRLPEVDDETGATLARRLEDLDIAPMRVPGLFYRSHPESGADLAAADDWLETDVPLVPVDEVGTVEENAEAVAGSIRKLARGGRTVALLSASKGSADVLEALESHPNIGSLVSIWIDLVGVIEGTPLTNPGSAALRVTKSWLPAATAESMSEHSRRSAVSRGRFPANVRVVHIAAFPRVRDVSADARDAFQLLRKLGPTDGYVLLESYLRAPGRVLVIRGTDHYLRTARLPRLVAATFLVITDEIGDSRG